MMALFESHKRTRFDWGNIASSQATLSTAAAAMLNGAHWFETVKMVGSAEPDA
jgi:hypothetical protein